MMQNKAACVISEQDLTRNALDILKRADPKFRNKNRFVGGIHFLPVLDFGWQDRSCFEPAQAHTLAKSTFALLMKLWSPSKQNKSFSHV